MPWPTLPPSTRPTILRREEWRCAARKPSLIWAHRRYFFLRTLGSIFRSSLLNVLTIACISPSCVMYASEPLRGRSGGELGHARRSYLNGRERNSSQGPFPG